MRPRRMKRITLTVLSRDVDRVLEYLGKAGVLQPSLGEGGEGTDAPRDRGRAVERALARIREVAGYLSLRLPEEPGATARLPSEEDAALLETLCGRIEDLRGREHALLEDRRKTEDALTEAQAFAHLEAPFSDLERLSYLTLRLGRVETRKREELAAALGDRAVLIPLDEGDRVLAASSRKGRFALDAELKKAGFEAIAVPEGFTGVPEVMLAGLQDRIRNSQDALGRIDAEKAATASECRPALERLAESFAMASAVEGLKARLESIQSAFSLHGWVVAEGLPGLVAELERLTDGRIAVTSYDPEELPEVREGAEKVPVSLEHGAFVAGFERLVFSYGAPLYGTIDPTPIVACSFTILFGLMFGDVGHGFALLSLGLLTTRREFPFFHRFSRFAPALLAVGIASMVVGILDGEIFANSGLLIRPTRAITGFFTGVPVDRVLHLMPEAGSLERLYLFFGFTLAVGVVLNTLGLVVNIVNLVSLKRWEKLFFSKTGLSGALLFWYALGIALRVILGGSLAWFDVLGLGLPLAALFLGPALWRYFSGDRPVLADGLVVYLVEGFVEILESTSYYFSNTVSFLRVGAFALSHAVLSFIVFTLSSMVAGVPGGGLFSILVLLVGNTIIVFLEGLIVAIQTIRLQYYEFFSKFFTETGVEFTPFRFRKGGDS